LEATGRTRNRTYQLKTLAADIIRFDITHELEEDTVWRHYLASPLSNLAENVQDICQYGFTEMFNNVLDHSGGTRVTISFTLSAASVQMEVTDDGVGIFRKIQSGLDFEDPRHALLELAKGKLTTDPERHTGEGIFFATRLFDRFVIHSDSLTFGHLSEEDTWLAEQKQSARDGTNVKMQIDVNSARSMKKVFRDYSTCDGERDFSRTQVPVKLLRYGDENLLSRSQAKRLLTRLDRFEEVILDFQGLEFVGKAFTDEIFRVYKREHPDVGILWINTSEDIEKIIRHATAQTAS
jgi:anti-sigma regulatory factor (Ser/Thr protein kinase)